MSIKILQLLTRISKKVQILGFLLIISLILEEKKLDFEKKKGQLIQKSIIMKIMTKKVKLGFSTGNYHLVLEPLLLSRSKNYYKHIQKCFLKKKIIGGLKKPFS